MDFEWDPGKDKANQAKHGIGFEEAMRIFDGPVLTRPDDRAEHDESRDISLGALWPDGVLVVVHTERGETVRIISARKANRRERKVYYDHLAQAQERD